MLELEIPELPPAEYSANNSRGKAYYEQYRASHGDEKGRGGARELFKVLLNEAGWQGPVMERARIRVTFHLPDRRRRDPGGLQERMKPWFDALVYFEVIKDDDLEHIGFPEYLEPVYGPGGPKTIIEIVRNEDGRASD